MTKPESTDATRREANSGDINQTETVTEGMQGADGNVDANGLDRDMSDAQKQDKLDELKDNLGQ